MQRLSDEVLNNYLIKIENNKLALRDTLKGVPLKLDIGCGNGHFLVDIAKEEPESFFVGIDIKFGRICKCISKLSKRSLTNAFLFTGRAEDFLPLLEDKSVAEIFYNFPDPWPKRRHHKKRLFTSSFLDTLYRIMKDEGIFTCATDDKDYLIWMLSYLENDKRFAHSFEEKVVNHIEGYHNTLFEKMWREMGKEIYYYRFKKA